MLPVSLVICNDVMAYIFGFFFGRTRLTELSPKKTWEGFIGALFSTVIFGFMVRRRAAGKARSVSAPLTRRARQMAAILARYEYFICPINVRAPGRITSTARYWSVQLKRGGCARAVPRDQDIFQDSFRTLHCAVRENFRLHEYELPGIVQQALQLSGLGHLHAVTLYPIQLHSLAMSTFASIIAPFGGFFASGFKRAFKIKDFGSTIPGHGGITDRFDCQYLMATFAYVYYQSFVRSNAVPYSTVLDMALHLDQGSKKQLLQALGEAVHEDRAN